jgi:hypothetical protein
LLATVILECDDVETAAAIAKAVTPDNSVVPAGLTVNTTQENKLVVTHITLERKLATFIATLDDLLECASTAEKTLNILKTKQQQPTK